MQQSNEKEEAKQFKKHLFEFWQNKNVNNLKIPQIGGRELDLYQLYKAVCKRGGAELVSNNKLWKDIVNEFGLPSSCTSASFTLRNHYTKYLLAYEQRYFFGRDDEKAIKELAGARQRKMIKYNENYINDMNMEIQKNNQYWEGHENKVKSMVINGPFRIHQHTNRFNSIKSILNDRYRITNNPGCLNQEKETLNSQVYYIRKQKIQPQQAELQRIILCLEGKVKPELLYTINTLLLYSCNYSHPVQLENLQELVEAITDFMFYIGSQIQSFKKELQRVYEEYHDEEEGLQYQQFYKYGVIESYEYLRSMFQILRNFSFTKNNESVLFRNEQLFNLIYYCFMDCSDNEIKRLSLEIMAQMSSQLIIKQYKDGFRFINTLSLILQTQPEGQLESVLECFCNLFQLTENEQVLEQVLVQHLHELNTLLINQNLEIRTLSLKILSYLSDLKMSTRNLLSQLDRCPQRLVGLLTSTNNSKEDRISKLSLNIIANLVISEIGKQKFAQYQSDLFIVSSTDQVLSKGLAQIIAELEKYQETFQY